MKKKISLFGGIVILLIASGITVHTCKKNTLSVVNDKEPKKGVTAVEQEDTLNEQKIQDYLEMNLSEGYHVEYDKDAFEAYITYEGEKIGCFSFFDCADTTTQAFVSTMEGMHANAKDEGTEIGKGTCHIIKTVVEYELSAAEAERGEEVPAKQIHYYYYNSDREGNLVGDLFFDSDKISQEEKDRIAGKIVFKG